MNAVMHPPSAYVKTVYQTDISVRPHTSLFDTGLQVPLHKYLNDIEYGTQCVTNSPTSVRANYNI